MVAAFRRDDDDEEDREGVALRRFYFLVCCCCGLSPVLSLNGDGDLLLCCLMVVDVEVEV